MSGSTVRISRSAIRANFRSFARVAGGAHFVVPVVKANAYGHGTVPVVRALRGLVSRGLAVAHAGEALALRHFYRGRIIVLSAWTAEDARRAARQGIELVAWDRSSLRVLAMLGTRRTPVAVHLKLDSGTGRLGTRTERAAPFLAAAMQDSRIRLRGVFTHFADAEDETDGFTRKQLSHFLDATRDLPASVERHAACTAAVLRFVDTRLDFVRLGLGLYGLWPSRRSQRSATALQPALRWVTRVQQIRQIPPGSTVGYGRTFRTRNPRTIAVLPTGYADGYPRALSNAGFVTIRGHRCPVVGRVSMNLTTVDATGCSARVGDSVVLLGGQGSNDPTASAIAAAAGTISYEIVSRIAEHVPRELA